MHRVVLARVGDTAVSTVRTYLKAITYVSEDYNDCVWSTGFAIVSPGPELDPRFLYYVARSQWFVAEVQRRSFGVSYPAINAEDIGDILCPLPPIEEQRRIADVLDRETSRTDQVLGLFRLLTRLIAERERAHADRRLASLGTRETRLKFVLSGIEQGWSPQCEPRAATGDEWGVLKAGCVNYGIFRRDENKALPAGEPPRPDLSVKEGDLLMSRANTRELAGSVALVSEGPGRLILCDKLYRLHVDGSAALPEFLAFALRASSVREQIQGSTSGASGSMQNISQELVGNLRISLPRLGAQLSISQELRERQLRLLQLLDRIAAQQALTEERRDALISTAVAGQLDPASYQASAVRT